MIVSGDVCYVCIWIGDEAGDEYGVFNCGLYDYYVVTYSLFDCTIMVPLIKRFGRYHPW